MEKTESMEGKQMKWLEISEGKNGTGDRHRPGFKASWLCVMLEMEAQSWLCAATGKMGPSTETTIKDYASVGTRLHNP